MLAPLSLFGFSSMLYAMDLYRDMERWTMFKADAREERA